MCWSSPWRSLRLRRSRWPPYPDKPIQLIVPYSAGGSTDVLARAIGQVAPRFFPQPVVIVNKAGGGGIPGRVDVVKSKAGRLHPALRLGVG